METGENVVGISERIRKTYEEARERLSAESYMELLETIIDDAQEELFQLKPFYVSYGDR